MRTSSYSVAEAVELGGFTLKAYELYWNGDPATIDLGDYCLYAKLYAKDITLGMQRKVFGFIARQKNKGSDVVVAIRGTEGILEWIKDFEFRLIDFPYVPNCGRTERGFTTFYQTLEAVRNGTTSRCIAAIQELVHDGSVKTLRIAAHSLGGAMATLLAMDIVGNRVFASPTIYTLASPKPGDAIFASTFDGSVTDSWRIWNCDDLVPTLPRRKKFVHVDSGVGIDSGDEAKQTIACLHSIFTYLHTLDPNQPLEQGCSP